MTSYEHLDQKSHVRSHILLFINSTYVQLCSIISHHYVVISFIWAIKRLKILNIPGYAHMQFLHLSEHRMTCKAFRWNYNLWCEVTNKNEAVNTRGSHQGVDYVRQELGHEPRFSLQHVVTLVERPVQHHPQTQPSRATPRGVQRNKWYTKV